MAQDEVERSPGAATQCLVGHERSLVFRDYRYAMCVVQGHEQAGVAGLRGKVSVVHVFKGKADRPWLYL